MSTVVIETDDLDWTMHANVILDTLERAVQ